MRTIYLGLLAIVLLAACKNGKPTPQDEAHDSDSVATIADTDAVAVAGDLAADGLFDDFAYTFMHNKKFQLSRIKFPLPNLVDGKDAPVTAEQWTFDPLYSKDELYVMIFDSEAAVKSEKDTTINHVTVEKINLTAGRVKQYHFTREKRRWMLSRMETHDISLNPNSDFLAFYRRFATDAAFQQRHIVNPFRFKTYDPDSYQQIDGLLDVAQWPDFRPAMPAKTITNINYGQKYAAGGQRVMIFTGASAGMSSTLTFSRRGRSWRLVALESI